jgi:hypothetical protein
MNHRQLNMSSVNAYGTEGQGEELTAYDEEVGAGAVVLTTAGWYRLGWPNLGSWVRKKWALDEEGKGHGQKEAEAEAESDHRTLFIELDAMHRRVTSTQANAIEVRYPTAQNSTAQYSTAQHSTAQHSTAQHNTVQCSMGAQHSTAQHNTDTGTAHQEHRADPPPPRGDNALQVADKQGLVRCRESGPVVL